METWYLPLKTFQKLQSSTGFYWSYIHRNYCLSFSFSFFLLLALIRHKWCKLSFMQICANLKQRNSFIHSFIRRRTQTIAKRFPFHANATILSNILNKTSQFTKSERGMITITIFMKIYSDWYSRHIFRFRFIFVISSHCP